jgi:hypothetical protein
MQIFYSPKYLVFFLSKIALLSSLAVHSRHLATKEQRDIKELNCIYVPITVDKLHVFRIPYSVRAPRNKADKNSYVHVLLSSAFLVRFI